MQPTWTLLANMKTTGYRHTVGLIGLTSHSWPQTSSGPMCCYQSCYISLVWWISEHGSPTSSIYITQKLVRIAYSWPHRRPCDSKTLGMKASTAVWFWCWSLTTIASVNSFCSFKVLFHTFPLLQLLTTPSPYPLPPNDHFYFKVNRKQKYSTQKRTSSSSYIPNCLHLQVLPDPGFFTGAEANPSPHLHTTSRPFFLLRSFFPLHRTIPSSTQMSLCQRPNKNKQTSLKNLLLLQSRLSDISLCGTFEYLYVFSCFQKR